ncbi:hypothetical protein EC9_42690 [Rosistilla ulvae]|uniref:DUF4276 family protein n=1 Tax=Rosistilla ulvae TaxID=1930277 RepID=A0A517M5B4_9BACT|nr:hypothetical protein [Rosistilla ulvae]QDS90065.1 hypothetical protein EC9_42690 [Rosistilla ulvae]
MISTRSLDAAVQRRIWVICEGKHEQSGALECLIRRIMPAATACEFVFESWKNPRGVKRRFRASPKGDGVFKKLIAALIDASELQYDGVVCVIDCDRDPGRVQSVDRAQYDETFAMARAFGVAIETFDACFLADEKSLSSTLRCNVDMQKDPESNRDAKQTVRDLRDASGIDLGLAECYANLAEVADLSIMAQRCPKGFAVWRKRVEQL